MPTISSLKKSVISALRSPNEAPKPQLKRRVIPFSEAIENLKTAKNGVVTCVAFHTFGRCRREIALLDSDFLANLGQLDMNDVQTPMKLMPLMLCASHWEKTVYHNALFLDWLFTYGSKQDSHHYESIVVDYQSAVAMDEEQGSALSIPVPSKHPEEDIEGATFPQESFTNVESSVVAEEALVAKADLRSEQSHTNDALRVQSNCEEQLSLKPEDDVPAVSVLMSMDAFASIEFGVVKLEIIYQDNLKCIAKSSDGWRCPEIIDQEQLLKARRHLSISGHCQTEADIAPLPPLVLCPGHAQGDLPRIYTDKWTTFAEQRLPKKEAMQKFNAEHWLSVQFFPRDTHDDHAFLANRETPIEPGIQEEYIQLSKRLRSASTSDVSGSQAEKGNLANNAGGDSARGDFLSIPGQGPSEFKKGMHIFSGTQERFTASDWAHTFKSTSIERREISEARSMDDLRSDVTTFPKASAAQLASHRPRMLPVRIEALNGASFNFGGVNLDLSTATASDPGSTDSTAPMSRAFTGLKIADDVPQAEHDTMYKPFLFKAVAGEKVLPDTQPAGAHKEIVEPAVSQPKSEEIAKTSTSSHSQPMVDSKHSNMLAQIKAPITNKDWLFIFSSQDNKLVKVGKATTTSCRKQKILYGCSIPDSAECTVDLRLVSHPEQVIKLVHMELRNFEAKISCEHLNKKGFVPPSVQEEHRAWFEVPKGVAVISVELWRDFVREAYAPEGRLREHWLKMLESLPTSIAAEIEALETSLEDRERRNLLDHHLLQNKRYREWFEEGKKLETR